MKTIVSFFILLFFFSNNASADTIDFWHIYHNKNLIKQSTQINSYSLNFKLQELNEFDSITVIYFSDTPCSECRTYLKSDDGTKAKLMMAENIGTSSPLKFKVKDLLRYYPNGFKGVIKLFYIETKPNLRVRDQKVLEIRFE